MFYKKKKSKASALVRSPCARASKFCFFFSFFFFLFSPRLAAGRAELPGAGEADHADQGARRDDIACV